MNWRTFLFPYRSHLEAEIEYLRGQLQQRLRRQDELEGSMLELLQKLREKTPRETPKNLEVPVRGWDAYRARRRGNFGNEGAVEDDTAAVSAQPDARGQSSPDDFKVDAEHDSSGYSQADGFRD